MSLGAGIVPLARFSNQREFNKMEDYLVRPRHVVQKPLDVAW